MKAELMYIILALFMSVGILIGIITIHFTDRINETEKRLDEVEEQIEILKQRSDIATVTDATMTDATPKEPSDDEIVIEVRDVFKEDAQKVSKEIATPSEPDLEEQPERICAGCYELTAYIETGNPCADGVYPQVGYTAACNDSRLWHKWIEIEGYGTYYVHDTGGMASNVIDIFVGSYDEAIQFGRRSAEVYILE